MTILAHCGFCGVPDAKGWVLTLLIVVALMCLLTWWEGRPRP